MAIELNYDAGKNGVVKKHNILHDTLISNQPKVLFVGEGDFSFTVAFAALRCFGQIDHSTKIWENMGEPQMQIKEFSDVWSRITSTRYERKPVPSLEEVKITCIKLCADFLLRKILRSNESENEAEMKCSRYDIELNRWKLKEIKNLPNVPEASMWLYGIDALSIPPDILRENGVIWFQCPWVPSCCPNDPSTHDLISGFLLSIAKHINKETLVCIGITTRFPYIKNYQLQKILGENLAADSYSTEVLAKYDFWGADDQLVNEVLSFGYYHHTVHEAVNIHHKILDHHITLMFIKR